MKICNKCKEEFSYDSFYRDRHRKDGFSTRCKDCDRLKGRMVRERNTEAFKEKDRRYYKNNRAKIILKRKEYYKKNALKVSAGNKVKTAVYNGTIKRQRCEVCGSQHVHAHHDDYLKPLDVRWLCPKHHARHHAELSGYK